MCKSWSYAYYKIIFLHLILLHFIGTYDTHSFLLSYLNFHVFSTFMINILKVDDSIIL